MEIRFDDKMVEVIEGAHVYVDDKILTSWDYLSPERQNRAATIADSIRELARELEALIEEAPTDTGDLDELRMLLKNGHKDQLIADGFCEVIGGTLYFEGIPYPCIQAA